MKVFKLLLLCLLPFIINAQNQVQNELMEQKSQGAEFTPIDFFSPSSKSMSSLNIDSKVLEKAAIVDLESQSMREMFAKTPTFLTMQIPTASGNILELELVRHQLFAPDFQLIDSKTNLSIPYEQGLHYKGIINGDQSSVAAISFYPEEVMGLVNTSNGNFVIAKKDRNNAAHIIYNDSDLKKKPSQECGTPEDDYVYTDKELNFSLETKDVGDCIEIYIEIDNDVVVDKGGAVPATNHITGLFNQSFVLYSNEQVNMTISEIKAWTTTSPYSSSSSSGMLNSFQANTGAFNGDLGHLVSYQASGGIAAGFSGVCASNPDDSKCFSSIDGTYSNVPIYSFSVFLITHEMGHLVGSRHTHACVWNGNGTAIDGCSGFTEGSCPLPGNPSGGGTIMSYCSNTSVGVNFNLGFGPQPGNVIRATVANATCLDVCGAGPTCSDGIQNGDETGVDCGGSVCPACPSCNDGIQNGDETGIDCGGSTCPPCPATYCASSGASTSFEWIDAVTVADLTNVSGNNGGYQDFTSSIATLNRGNAENVALTPGFSNSSYNEFWTIWIDYNGDLDFNDAGETVFSGSGTGLVTGAINVPTNAPLGITRMRVSMKWSSASTACENFTYGEVEDYSVLVVQGSTCNDGIQNGDETGVDCGGSCPACPVTYCGSEGTSQSFEWIDAFSMGTINNVSGNNGGYADFTNQVLATQAGASYSFSLTPGFGSGTYTENWRVWIDYNIDGDFDDPGELVIQAAGNSVITGSITIPSNTALGNARMRVSMKWSSYSTPCEVFTYGEVEDYTVSLSPGAFTGDGYESPELFVSEEFSDNDQFTLTPNPASKVVNLNYDLLRQANVAITVYDIQGQQIMQKNLTTDSHRLNHALDISALADGIYYVNMVQDGINLTSKFIVINQ